MLKSIIAIFLSSLILTISDSGVAQEISTSLRRRLHPLESPVTRRNQIYNEILRDIEMEIMRDRERDRNS